MTETKNDALSKLKIAFHILTRNLYTYGNEEGMFHAHGEKDLEIHAVARGVANDLDYVTDDFARAITEKGSTPIVGGYPQIYTAWTFSTERHMLPKYLAETSEQRARLITLRDECLAIDGDTEHEVTLLNRAIHLMSEALDKLNKTADGVCELVTIEDDPASMEQAMAAAKVGGHGDHGDHGHDDHGHDDSHDDHGNDGH